METSDRRTFLRSLIGDAARAVAGDGPARPPVTRCATAGELAELAAACGLADRMDHVRSLARASVRLQPGRHGTGRSHLGGSADLPGVRDWPAGFTHVLQLDLGDVARRSGGGLDLPAEGMLWCFRAGTDVRLVLRARAAPLAAAAAADPARTPVTPAAELVLPRAGALGLAGAEADGWEDLRSRLATLQGFSPPDDRIRLLGHPDGELAPAGRRLLLQLPSGRGERLLVWVAAGGLADGSATVSLRATV